MKIINNISNNMNRNKLNKVKTEPIGTCKDCVYSYDYYNKNVDNELIMCKCKIKPYSQLLIWTCKEIKLK